MNPSHLSSLRDRDRSAGNVLNVLALLAVCAALGVAFYYQLEKNELPCPLCLLQRAGLILTGIGLMMNVRFGVRAAHYGVALAGALATGVIALRQVLLHIAPGDAGYGSTFMGLHFYTLAALSSLAAVAGIALLLMLKSWEPPASSGAWKSAGGKLACILFILLVAGNLASTVLECGAGACEDNPTGYLLLGK
ncbi:disulfide bond formation protein B [Herbaspirillum sp. LeCh32-8]|uniref:disulfide bond formation protein B n=1 Tax=Herbaspirillum sp. LeCh32-8 TaxID=2821356 RepID=UPI001AEB62E9|nr:disulfide bond formation protein B [Herbaspirillum sp. LeCh32-8]MBP0598073.1 disulfide bond formation protein B [Herbaspirillum sp. LeCh32-8]